MLVQYQSHSLRPLTTAHLAQTMTLLGLSALELHQKIEAELASNPALELAEETRCPSCHRPLVGHYPCPVCSQPQGMVTGEPIVFVSPRDDFNIPRTQPDAYDTPENLLAAEAEDLPTYVLRQIASELEPEDRPIAAHVLTSLDEDGLLRIPRLEIARYHHVPLSHVEKIVHLIQHADPLGVGSASPQEALLVQLEALREIQSVPALADQVIREDMDLLYRCQYSELAHRLKISLFQATEIVHFISDNLNPYPARAHWGDIRQGTNAPDDAYYHADIVISRSNPAQDAPLMVEVISPLAGKLRLNPLFKEALQDAPEEMNQEWQAHIDRATLLVKCLQQRDHTIVRLMQKLAALQRGYILNGDAYLAPCTRASLAIVLQLHESTISRAVSNKAVQLPNGRIVPLSRFFDRSLHIRTALNELISHENKPLTDTQLVNLLQKQGYMVARRTVAKYRAMEGILPAHMRSKFKTKRRSKPVVYLTA